MLPRLLLALLLLGGAAIGPLALWDRAWERSVAGLALDLSEPDAARAARAREQLVAAGADVVPPLLRLFDETPLAYELWISSLLSVLREQPREQVVPPLLHALASADGLVRHHAANALAFLGPALIPELTPLLEPDQPARVRLSAAWALVQMGPDCAPAVPALEALRDDPDHRVRHTVGFALHQARAPVGSHWKMLRRMRAQGFVLDRSLFPEPGEGEAPEGGVFGDG